MAMLVRNAGLRAAQPRVAVRPALAPRIRSVKVQASAEKFDSGAWIKKDPLVLVLGFLGWTLPANIGVSGFGGNSLFGLFTSSIGQELSHFPTGPALDSPFWLYFSVYHVGLFLTILLGQVGVQGRKQGYW